MANDQAQPCRKCGEPVHVRARFCTACGAPRIAPESEQTRPPSAEADRPTVPTGGMPPDPGPGVGAPSPGPRHAEPSNSSAASERIATGRVGFCPKCSTAIHADYGTPRCSTCGENLPEDIRSKLPALLALLSPEPSQGDAASPTVNRYRDAYRVAASLITIGDLIKVAGGVIGGVIVLASLAAGGAFGFILVLLGVVAAAVVGVLLWAGGVVIAAQGQILLAALDTAISTSRFLTDHERASAMGLPASIADRQGGTLPPAPAA